MSNGKGTNGEPKLAYDVQVSRNTGLPKGTMAEMPLFTVTE